MEDECFYRKREHPVVVLGHQTHGKDYCPPSGFAEDEADTKGCVDQAKRIKVSKHILVQVVSLTIAKDAVILSFVTKVKRFLSRQ
jgi:hypothetical protein